MIDFNRNHFELFGLPAAYAIDAEALEQAYRDIQAEIHPDRFAHAGDADKRLAMQWTTRVNEAYLTLRRPFERARYLLELRGIHAMDARNTAMPADFLVQQLDWREQLEEARSRGDLAALQRLEGRMREVAEGLERELAGQLDDGRDDQRATETLRKYRFMDKLLSEIDQAFEEIDAM